VGLAIVVILRRDAVCGRRLGRGVVRRESAAMAPMRRSEERVEARVEIMSVVDEKIRRRIMGVDRSRRCGRRRVTVRRVGRDSLVHTRRSVV